MTVCIGNLHPMDVGSSFRKCFTYMFVHDAMRDERLIEGEISTWCTATHIADGRNEIAAEFLDNWGAEWLFWIDSDMSFQRSIIDDLLAVADPVARPVVGALAFAQRVVRVDHEYNVPVFEQYPTLFDFDKSVESFRPRPGYTAGTLNKVDGTGGAAILVHRSCYERTREIHGDNWYTPIRKGDDEFSEDLSFCFRLMCLHVPMYVHTGIQTKHQKTCYLDESSFVAQSERGEA